MADLHRPTIDHQWKLKTQFRQVHTASETFDVGTDLGSPVALDYLDRVLTS
jgi:hypothetical protein